MKKTTELVVSVSAGLELTVFVNLCGIDELTYLSARTLAAFSATVATRLSVKDGEAMREIFWSSRVVDLRVDCQKGQGEVEISGDPLVQIKTGETWTDGKPGRLAITLAQAGVLHLALIGTGGQIPLAGFEADAAIYDVFGEKLHLAGATTLKAKIGDETREILWAPQPVNVMVDLRTGEGEIEIRGEHPLQVKTGVTWSNRKPGRQAAVFAQAGALPKVGDLLEAMWNRSKSLADTAAPETARGERVFQEKPTPTTFRRPLRRLTAFVPGSKEKGWSFKTAGCPPWRPWSRTSTATACRRCS